MTRLLLVAAALVVVLAAGVVSGAGAEWDVYPGAGTPIQDAVDGAGEGDSIYVHAGTYIENVNVDKRLTLIGEGADVVTVRAADAGDHVFEVTADWVNISGFTVTGATDDWTAGIHLYNADHCSVSENNVSNNRDGVHMGCYSNNNTLQNNTADSNDYGICIDDSSNNTLQSNTMSGNTYNFDVSSHSLSHYIQNIDANNTVDGKSIYYWVDQQDKQIPDDAGMVGVVNSTNITVKDLTLTNNTQGVLFVYTGNSRIENVTTSDNRDSIYLWYSNNNTLTSNTASNNSRGIYLWYSNNNMLSDNTANSNNYGGIFLVHSSSSTLTSNTASDNNLGICLYTSCNNSTLENNNALYNEFGILLDSSSSNNTLYHNNLINNAYDNAYDYSGTNQWDSGSVGNYYSDYNGTDPDGDGIGNDPYPIPGGESVDRFPLMHPWTGGTLLKGDLNRDGILTPADAVIALCLAAGGSASCDATTLAAADVSGDNRVTSLDALMILQAATAARDV